MYLVCCYEIKKNYLQMLRTNTCKERRRKKNQCFCLFKILVLCNVISARMLKVSSFQKKASKGRITLLKNLYFHGKFLQLQK